MLNQNITPLRPGPSTQNNNSHTRQQNAAQADDWRSQLAAAVRDSDTLRRLTGLAGGESPPCKNKFSTLVPHSFINRMRCGDPNDPLLVQVMPNRRENDRQEGFVADPLDESPKSPASAATTPCLLQKYPGRSLILTTAECGVHCRYCFRRHLPHWSGDSRQGLLQRLGPAIERVAADTSIREVILSGGDPLTIDDAPLAELIERLNHIPHLRRLRVHTRMPIVIPQRVTSDLIGLLRSSRLSATVVIQANHVNELSDGVEASLASLVDAGVPVLCQSVLLAGVNDNIEALASLCERLIDMRVMPYYLHQLDRVAGAAHFEVPVERGQQLIAALRQRLPGYAVPCYVREVPGESGKRPLA